MSDILTRGHYGCPECGCQDFSAQQRISDYGDQTVHCTFTDEEEGDWQEYDIEDYGDTDYYDSDSGDMDNQKTCRDCGHDYTEPEFYPNVSVENIAEASGLDEDEVEALSWIFDEHVPHAAAITISLERHATVIIAKPATEQRGKRWCNDSWFVEKCCKCDGDMSESFQRTRQVFTAIEGVPSKTEKLVDARQLPVLLCSTVCRKCRHGSV